MNNKYRYFCIISIVLMSILPLSGVVFGEKEERDKVGKLADRFNKKQALEFGPSYVADSILNQNYKDNVQSNIDLNNQILSQSKQSPVPAKVEIKGARGRGASQMPAETVELNTAQVNTPFIHSSGAGLPKRISDYLNKQSGLYANPAIKNSGGFFKIFWKEAGSGSMAGKYSLNMQTFAKDGSPASAGKTVLSDYGRFIGKDDTEIMLSNGNVVSLWQENGDDGEISLKLTMFKEDGTAVKDKSLELSGPVKWMDLHSTSLLSNGNTAVIWTDVKDETVLRMQIVKDDGSTYFEKNYVLTRNAGRVDRTNVVLIPGGNIAVSWNETDKESRRSLKIQICKKDATPLFDGSYVLAQSMISAELYSVSSLSNGNISVTWKEQDPSEKWSVKNRIFNGDGAPVEAKK